MDEGAVAVAELEADPEADPEAAEAAGVTAVAEEAALEETGAAFALLTVNCPE